MHLTAQEAAQLAGGTLEGVFSGHLSGAAGIEEAGPMDISFLGNPKYADRVASSRAGIIFVPESTPAQNRPVIRVKNPQLAFAQVLGVIERERASARPRGIHPSAVIAGNVTLGKDVAIGACAVIEHGAVIGPGTTIMPHCYIGNSSVIGEQCLLYPSVTVRENVRVGSRVILHSGAVLGSDGFGFVPGRQGHYKIPQIGTVIIGDDVEIGSNTTVDRATTGATTIGKGTKIDNLVQIAHNVRIGEHCFIVAQAGIAGSARVGNFVTFAGQSGTVGHIDIGDGATVAARAGVMGPVKPGETVSGYPARPHREALKIEALIRRLPEIYAWFRNEKRSE